jgi:hypothetical protein
VSDVILYTKWWNNSLGRMHNFMPYLTNILEVQIVSPMVSPFAMPEYIVFVCVCVCVCFPTCEGMKYYTLNINGVFIA